MTERIAKIRQQLEQTLHPSILEITDDSDEHIGHAGNMAGGGHYSLAISCPAFAGKNMLECHRIVYEALGSLMHHEIHALQIKVYQP
jgi:BolA protein